MFIKKVALIASTFIALTQVSFAKPSEGIYAIDASHTSINFSVDHMGYSQVVGRFNDVSGEIKVASSSSLNVTIKSASIDTNHGKRDEHLKSPDFFNVKQFPTIKFTSPLSLSQKDGATSMEGELELLGVTKRVKLTLKKGNEGKDPWGLYRIGYSADLTVKRSDFGMDFMAGGIGDDIDITINVEAVKK